MIGIVAADGLGGYWLRRWIAPEFSGALARLGDVTIGVALFVVTLQLLGTLSLLRLGWIIFFAVFLHKIPEGFTVTSVMLASGVDTRQCPKRASNRTSSIDTHADFGVIPNGLAARS